MCNKNRVFSLVNWPQYTSVIGWQKSNEYMRRPLFLSMGKDDKNGLTKSINPLETGSCPRVIDDWYWLPSYCSNFKKCKTSYCSSMFCILGLPWHDTVNNNLDWTEHTNHQVYSWYHVSCNIIVKKTEKKHDLSMTLRNSTFNVQMFKKWPFFVETGWLLLLNLVCFLSVRQIKSNLFHTLYF